jgi:hypothetical protein
MFLDLGVSVRWEVGTDARPSTGGDVSVQAVLMPSEPAGWGIAPNAMGVVLLPDGSRPESVFLFFPSTLRSLGLANKTCSMLHPRERKDLARAIGRVLVHESVRAVFPTLSHADEASCARESGSAHERHLGAPEGARRRLARGLRARLER